VFRIRIDLNTDQNPAFGVNADPDPTFNVNADPDVGLAISDKKIIPRKTE